MLTEWELLIVARLDIKETMVRIEFQLSNCGVPEHTSIGHIGHVRRPSDMNTQYLYNVTC